MFTSTGNNFGASPITFRDFQTDRFIVLNARFTYDPSSPLYKAAQELEISVPSLTLDRSTEAGVFAVFKDERTYDWSGTPYRYHFATVLRSSIKNRNTLVIEKFTDFDTYGPATIYIYAMYSGLNTGLDTVRSVQTRLDISFTPEVSGHIPLSSCIIQPDWVSLNMVLPYAVGDVDGDLTIDLGGFPADAQCGEFPVVGSSNQYHQDTGGVHYASLSAGRITIPATTRNNGYSSADDPFLSLVLVRDKAKSGTPGERLQDNIESI